MASERDERIGQLAYLGRRYVFAETVSSRTFHPKLIARLSPTGGRIWVGSGNLTYTGWGGNQEVATAWPIGPSEEDRGLWLAPLLDAVSRVVKSTAFATHTPTDRLIEALVWGANELQGDLWESLAHWIPSVIRRLKEDDTAYAQMRDALFAQPSPGVKASFPGLLGRARDLTEDLRSWCRSESQRAEGILVGEVGMDLIPGQRRLVVQSLFDLLSGREI